MVSQNTSGSSAMNCREGRWFVLRTHPRKEKSVFDFLILNGCEAKLPIADKSFYRGKSFIKKSGPLITGYVFVRDTGKGCEKFRFIPGSCGLLCFCNKEVTVCDTDIEKLEKLCVFVPTPQFISSLVCGQKIRITGGVLKGIEGEIVDFKGKTEIIIHCGIPGYSFIVDVEREKIEIA